MAHLLGKFVFNSLMGMKIADVEYPDETKKCIVIPIKDNGIQFWKGEWQLWFRSFAYREPKSKFTHFIMKYIPTKDIKKLSQAQIEAFANHQIGGMMRSTYEKETNANRIQNINKD